SVVCSHGSARTTIWSQQLQPLTRRSTVRRAAPIELNRARDYAPPSEVCPARASASGRRRRNLREQARTDGRVCLRALLLGLELRAPRRASLARPNSLRGAAGGSEARPHPRRGRDSKCHLSSEPCSSAIGRYVARPPPSPPGGRCQR